jgi:hypothetical protein
MRALMAGWMCLLMVAILLAQGGWHPLGGWELIERLDNVQVIKIFRPDNLIGSPYPRWYPSGRGDFSLLTSCSTIAGQPPVNIMPMIARARLRWTMCRFTPIWIPTGKVGSASAVWRLWSTSHA